jgi:hypothetical protein
MEALVINDMSLFVVTFSRISSNVSVSSPTLTDSLSTGSIIRTTCDHVVELNVLLFEAENCCAFCTRKR